MAQNIKLEVVTPEHSVVDEEVKMVVAPGVLGEFGVLPGHTTFLTTLKVGTIRYNDASGQDHYVFVSGGFAEALPDKVTVLADTAERAEEIDTERAEEARKRAEQRMALPPEQVDHARAQAALLRSLVRLKVAQKRRKKRQNP